MTTKNDTAQSANERLAAEAVDGLHRLADLIRSNPDLVEHVQYPFSRLLIPLSHADDPQADLAALIRAGMAGGAVITKSFDEDYASVDIRWGPIGLHAYAGRAQVCERVVVGTETVTKKVKDPQALAEVPEIEVTEEVEKVEWVCKPLLAAESGSDGPR